jgi:murein DD-endopeptidase MepM/ murein hydrolase activator NlpD
MARRPKRRYFSLTDGDLNYSEIRWFRTKISFLLAAVSVLLLATLLGVNHYYYDFLGLGYNRIKTLTQENQALKQQLKRLTVQMSEIERTLDQFHYRTNELRLLVDLPAIDEDTRRAGAGGRNIDYGQGVLSTDARELVTNSVLLLDKISREIQMQRLSYEEVYKKYEFNKQFFACLPALKPMSGYYSPTGFGVRMHPVLGIYKTHDGLDIIADVGTPVYASGDGTVEFASHSGGGYGLVILIDHGYGYETLYAHLSKIIVRSGQRVRRGDLIGYSGKSGLVSGPHLHYEVRYRGVKKNPIDYFLDDVAPQHFQSFVTSAEERDGS